MPHHNDHQRLIQIIAAIFLVVATTAVGISFTIGFYGVQRDAATRNRIVWLSGYDAGRSTPTGWRASLVHHLEPVLAWSRLSYTPYTDGFTTGKDSLVNESASILAHISNDSALRDRSDIGMLHDSTHLLEGVFWRNVGILHMDELYDVSPAGHHLPLVARASDALLTEYGDYFNKAQNTAKVVSPTIITDSLHETRVRMATLDDPVDFLFSAYFATLMIVAIGTISLLTSNFYKSTIAHLLRIVGIRAKVAPPKSKTLILHRFWLFAAVQRIDSTRPGRLSLATIAASLIIFYILFIGALSWRSHSGRPQSLDVHLSTESTGAAVTSAINAYTYTWDEACELDSQSMYRGLLSFIQAHPGITSVATLTGNAHAQDFERYYREHKVK